MADRLQNLRQLVVDWRNEQGELADVLQWAANEIVRLRALNESLCDEHAEFVADLHDAQERLDQQARERYEAMRAVARRYQAGWHPVLELITDRAFWSKYDQTKLNAGIPDEPLTPAERAALNELEGG